MTSPGHAVQALVTDLGMLEKQDGELVLTARADGRHGRVDRARRARRGGVRLGPAGRPAASCAELEPPTPAELAALRGWDPQGWFLRG